MRRSRGYGVRGSTEVRTTEYAGIRGKAHTVGGRPLLSGQKAPVNASASSFERHALYDVGKLVADLPVAAVPLRYSCLKKRTLILRK
jgi:hypothetical protein